MGDLATALGEKVSGELIKAKDWNDLVVAVESIGEGLLDFSASVDQSLLDVSKKLKGLDERCGALEGQTKELGTILEAVRRQFLRVTLQVEGRELSMPFGDRMEIVAQVSDQEGKPLEVCRRRWMSRW